jgi:Zn2+/Cd2+-exporting ATPase
MLTLRRFQFDTNCLMFSASVGAVALQDYSEAAAVVFLFALSEWLEIRATTRARQALSAIIQLRPDTANLVHPSTKEVITINASKVPVGAIVSARAGDKIPCDGTVVDGYSTVDESSLTGESRPIRKSPNDQVSGGTINTGLSPLLIQTTATAENSAVSRLIRLVEEAQANRSETEKVSLFLQKQSWLTDLV